MANTTKPQPAETVDEYISQAPLNFRKVLENLRAAIKKAAPDAEELISYQIPTYKQNGALVHFAAFSDHCSLVVVNKDVVESLEKELKKFKTSGTTIHFTAENPLSEKLVEKIVNLRIRQNQERKSSAKKQV